MPKFRSRVVEIEAVQWNGISFELPIPDWLRNAVAVVPRGHLGSVDQLGPNLTICTLEGKMRADPGDWIVRGLAGELYRVKPQIFERKYEPIGEA